MLDIRSKAVTIDDYSSLFSTFCYCSPLFALFETIRTIWDYSLFAIRVFQTPFSMFLQVMDISSQSSGFSAMLAKERWAVSLLQPRILFHLSTSVFQV